MGLDIEAHANIRKFLNEKDRADADTISVDNDDFPSSLGTTKIGTYAKSEAKEDNFRFSAGSYFGYNFWRDDLCLKIHGIPAKEFRERIDEFRNKPFFYLIWMSDCQGSIGANICEKLLNDFREHTDKLKDFPKVEDWMKALEIGSRNGVVQFR